MSTHYRLPPSEVQARFSAHELRRLELAEHECPWGEAAATLRAVYLAERVAALLGDKKAGKAAQELLTRLLGPAPKARPAGLKALLAQRKKRSD